MGAPLSTEEKARRAVALTVAETAPRPPISDFTPTKVPEIGDRLRMLDGAIGEVVADVTKDTPPRRRIPDHPVITVTIAGAPGAGKSVIAHLIRNALAYEGIATQGPEGLRSLPWRRGVQDLIQRGISVQLQAETSDA